MEVQQLLLCGVWIITCLTHHVLTAPFSIQKTKGYGSAKNVLIFGIDGLGGVHLENVTAKYPGFRSFFDEGSYTTSARCETPTVSASNWGTLITGMTPAEAGIQANYWIPEYGRPKSISQRSHFEPISGEGVPESIFDVMYKQKDMKVYMGYTWDWFHHFATNTTVDEMFRGAQLPYFNGSADWLKCAFDFGCIKHSDEAVFNATVDVIQQIQPNFMFLHFSRLDKAGHVHCWGCKEYYDELEVIDGYIQKILQVLKETKTSQGTQMLDETLVMVVSDHGGYRNLHGECNGPNTECLSFTMTATMNVPLLLRGPRVKKGYNMTANRNYVANRDVVQTALHALGLRKGRYMTGKVLTEAFEETPPVVNKTIGVWRGMGPLCLICYIMLHLSIASI
ncbi:uncharacterized protein LOC124440816 isoform X1 [Xenia sp. Carnegie-2017]|uniref:uncharacterized protein LOC124440816 isoform X1 n=1 Tax=Xenia sp. Carnegie-2017 TaxID=2897299 RepID=UPI001F03A98D|nr:uncharacterized protein LOC124440816 isoform X1 [Xenia sp. Carnegie-2017]XP_046847210.1 uncharacterized protein LOC124440816 isoform X1 [Xenia sp. Carnegie-2017]